MIFIKILKNTIQIKNAKYRSYFDRIIVDMLSNKKGNPIVTKLFVTGRKLSISPVFITQFYFAVLKNRKKENNLLERI